MDNSFDTHRLKALESMLASTQTEGWVEFGFQRELNWAGPVLTVMACRNHRDERVLDVFRWIAAQGADCYGVLFVREQESAHANEFRILRLARGVLTEMPDSILSPCVPTIESEYEPERET